MSALFSLLLWTACLGSISVAITLCCSYRLGSPAYLRPKPSKQAPSTAALAKQRNPVAITLRFRGIPHEIDETAFKSSLERDQGCGVVGLSWTASATTEAHIATICLSRRPRLIESIPKSTDGIDSLVALRCGSREVVVQADDNFHGMTPLYWPKEWDVDVVAVTGWNGKAFWSWKPESSEHMWLRDWLGPDLTDRGCSARIFTYGYPAVVANSSSDASYHDYGRVLLDSLTSARRRQYKVRKSRPLILIGHSLGGIVIKQALKYAHSSTDGAERDVLASCVGLFMFGVPNLGLENSAFITMTEGRKNETFARDLGRDSQYLPELGKDFSAAFRGRNINAFAIFETLDSPSVERKDGRWSRTGPLIRVVTKHSACSLGIPSEDKPSLTNHSNLVKFSTRDDLVYQSVLEKLVGIIASTQAAHRRSPTSHSIHNRDERLLGVPDQLTAMFVGRKDILQQIQACFSSDESYSHMFALIGNGGMGKTQIALQYIQTCSKDFERVFWIQSDSETRLQESFRGIARGLRLDDTGEGDTVTKQVLMDISRDPRKTLLVYDSLDATELLNLLALEHSPKWKQSPNISILVTTRNRRCLQQDELVCHAFVDTLDPHDAVVLLSKSAFASLARNAEESHQIKTICDALGCFPLGIQQAASYIKVTGTPLPQYLKQLRQEPRVTLGHARNWELSQKTVLTVWEDSMARIEAEHPFSAKLLSVVSFLDSSIPYSLFEMVHRFSVATLQSGQHPSPSQSQIEWIFESAHGSSAWSTATLHLCTTELQKLSMVKTSSHANGDTSLTLHALVQQWGRLRLPPSRQKEALSMAASLVHLWALELQRQHQAPADSYAAYVHQRQLLSHAYSCMESSSQVIRLDMAEFVPTECTVTFGMLLVHENKHDSAERMLNIALKRGSNDDNTTSSTLRTLSLALRRQRKFEGALLAQQEAIKLLRDTDHPRDRNISQIFRAQAELATIHRDLGNLEEALNLQSRVVDKFKAYLGEASLETLHEMSCLAIVLKRGGDFGQALHLEQRVLRVYRDEFGDRIEIWDKMRNLAITFYHLRRYDEAVSLEQEVLKGKSKLYGQDHVETASAMQNLATTYRHLGRYREALGLYSRALTIRESVLGHRDGKTRKTAKHLSEVERELLEDFDEIPPSTTVKPGVRVDSGIGLE